MFDLFDFNELNCLASLDIEFMLTCSISSTYKIFSISYEVNDEEITKFVGNSFNDESSVNITQFIKWTSRSQEIIDYFTMIKRDLPSYKAPAELYTNKAGDILQKVTTTWLALFN